jgi:hypothetical protein
LFQLGLELANEEQITRYAGIRSIASISSCVFLEHCEELVDTDRHELLLALVKRRAAREGLICPETELTAKEKAAVELYLRHNNSIHGTRPVERTASCKMEEDIQGGVLRIDLASKKQIKRAVLQELANKFPAAEVEHSAREIRWFVPVRSYRLFGMVDLSTGHEQATSLLVLCEGERGLHAHTSFLGVLGLGTTSWQFLPTGNEDVCAKQTVSFFTRVLDAFRDASILA